MYINIITSELLMLTNYIHTEFFLREAEIITSNSNIIFDKYEKIIQFDLKNILIELEINKDWKSEWQYTIDGRKRQLE